MTYKEWIDNLKRKWIGKKVTYDSEKYRVVDVDYNGFLLIGKKESRIGTTAIAIHMIKEEYSED